jgi:hypothetical protein
MGEAFIPGSASLCALSGLPLRKALTFPAPFLHIGSIFMNMAGSPSELHGPIAKTLGSEGDCKVRRRKPNRRRRNPRSDDRRPHRAAIHHRPMIHHTPPPDEPDANQPREENTRQRIKVIVQLSIECARGGRRDGGGKRDRRRGGAVCPRGGGGVARWRGSTCHHNTCRTTSYLKEIVHRDATFRRDQLRRALGEPARARPAAERRDVPAEAKRGRRFRRRRS